MRTQTISSPFAAPSWSTSSFADATAASPMELAALSEHLSLCQGGHSRLTHLHYAAEILHGFVATRFVTTLVLATLVIGGGLLVL